VVTQPGTNFVYTSAAAYLLSAIVSRTTGLPMADYLKPRLMEPLGISGYEWPVGPENITPGANGLSWKTADSLKLGILHAQNGLWQGKQILPAAWVQAVQAQHVKDTYGYLWWLGPNGAFIADGLFSQLSYVFPHHDAVLAITAGIPDGARVNRFVFSHFPAAFDDHTAPRAEAAATLKRRTAALTALAPPPRTGSPVVARVSGKRYTCRDNAQKVKALQWDFSTDGCVFTLEDERGTHTVRVGLGRAIEGDTSITGNELHHEYQLERMRVVASGEWRDARTFVMSWSFVESAFRDTVTCVFEGPLVRFDRSVNVNSAATSLPAVVGRMV
jgi:hypothetical protein